MFAVCFVVTFERLAKTFQFFKMIYAVARHAHKYKPSQNIKTVLIVQKIDLIQKYWVNFPNYKIKSLSLVLFIA